ncbi:AAA family ATPase [Brachyspira alvinipulli]|uniref:AAA family ATPase n=1 Tax=Brachyspira alvinipulli TaxID=84379 RepID=UPI000487CC4A|nr:AAA family ATPase [Brachyspira alvinipulli]
MINLSILIRSSINIVQVISYETMRIEGEISRTAAELKRDWYKWGIASGLKKMLNNGKNYEEIDGKDDALFILDWYQSDEAKNSILMLQDYELHIDSPRLISKIKDISYSNYSDRTLILLQTKRSLPSELEKDVYIVEEDLPDRSDLTVMFEHTCKQYNITPMGNKEKIVDSALGLTIMEAKRAFSKAIVQAGKLTEEEIPIIISEKETIIKNSGHLEYYHHNETLDDIGGLDVLKNWLRRRGRAFEQGAKDYGLETPRGILLLGIPGTGKSLCAKAVGAAWQFPIIKLDMGKVFAGHVGESESNIRKALKIAEAVSPSILWIDEIEKGLSGMQSSGSTDGGTTSRVLGTFLTWMQEKKKPVFVVATANDIRGLPPELLRKGRFDENFFVDLPMKPDREEIIKIHLAKFKRDYKNFDVSKIANECELFSGAEIEEAIKEALFNAFDEDKEVTTEHIIDAMKRTYPISKTFEDLEGMRRWARARAVLASSNTWAEDADSKNKPIPKLKQEQYNPFIQ